MIEALNNWDRGKKGVVTRLSYVGSFVHLLQSFYLPWIKKGKFRLFLIKMAIRIAKLREKPPLHKFW